MIHAVPMVGILTRDLYDDAYTFGRLDLYDGILKVYSCKTLELPWSCNTVRGSCIPAGVYPVVPEYSPRFDRELHELKLVPGRSEIKFHVANYVKQLQGCIGVGLSIGDINRDGVPDLKSSGVALSRMHDMLDGQMQWELQVVGDGRDTLQPGMNGYNTT